jgi:hypothetical protein
LAARAKSSASSSATTSRTSASSSAAIAAASPPLPVSARASTLNALRSLPPRQGSVLEEESTTPSARRVAGAVTPARFTASESQTSTDSERDAAYAGMDSFSAVIAAAPLSSSSALASAMMPLASRACTRASAFSAADQSTSEGPSWKMRCTAPSAHGTKEPVVVLICGARAWQAGGAARERVAARHGRARRVSRHAAARARLVHGGLLGHHALRRDRAARGSAAVVAAMTHQPPRQCMRVPQGDGGTQRRLCARAQHGGEAMRRTRRSVRPPARAGVATACAIGAAPRSALRADSCVGAAASCTLKHDIAPRIAAPLAAAGRAV